MNCICALICKCEEKQWESSANNCVDNYSNGMEAETKILILKWHDVCMVWNTSQINA